MRAVTVRMASVADFRDLNLELAHGNGVAPIPTDSGVAGSARSIQFQMKGRGHTVVIE